MSTDCVSEAVEPVATKQPLLKRFSPSTNVGHMDTEKHQLRLGGSVDVHPLSGEGKTVWLPATVWQGVATIIRHTPDDCRPFVAEFLKVLQTDMAIDHPLNGLLEEIIAEVQHDPYDHLSETPMDTFDFTW